jgi:hypothetical protein
MTKERFVSPSLVSYNICIVSFDLWMSKGGVDTFVLIMHLLNDKWEPCHVITGFFKTAKTFGSAMIFISDFMTNLLAKHGFNVYVFAYVKDERNILSP